MKRTFTTSVVGTALLLALGLTNCKKEQTAAPQDFTRTELSSPGSFASISATNADRIDAIVKDLSSSSYSLSFDQANAAAGITRTAYGADNYLVYVDPQDLICPDLFRRFQKKIPIWKIPSRATYTCPDMSIDPRVALKIQEFLAAANPAQFKGLQGIKTFGGEVLFSTETFKKQYTSLRSDKVDELLKGLNPEQFVLFNDALNPSGLLTRNFYGYANLDEYIFKPYKKKLKDILRPKYIGCIDYENLKAIKARLELINPAISKRLGVTPIDNATNVAILSF